MQAFLSALCCCTEAQGGVAVEIPQKSRAEIRKALCRFGIEPSEETLSFLERDTHNLTKFIDWVSESTGEKANDDMFKMIDADGNGKISAVELKRLLSDLNIGTLPEEVDEAMKLADDDADSMVDFQEFAKSKGLWAQVKLMLLVRRFRVQEEFDELAMEYNKLIHVWVPWYDEMLAVTVGALPTKPTTPVILELGCGTGNLSAAVLAALPGVTLHVVDDSKESLSLCRHRNRLNKQEVAYHQQDFMDLDFGAASLDHVVTTISLHHLEETCRKVLFTRTYKWLKPGGSLVYTDIFRGGDQEEDNRFCEDWKTASYAKGATDEQWSRFMEHDRKQDKHSSMAVVTGWLRKIGFVNIEVTWSRSLWATVVARKA
mmetsp:Transcript_93327/g.216989  ORF Transcript_93327/g.216989 Transcript_93327/m.216989 type:complete len:373 (+) Transcript_93327:55-1173(+)